MTPSNTQTYLAKGTTASGFPADRTVVPVSYTHLTLPTNREV